MKSGNWLQNLSITFCKLLFQMRVITACLFISSVTCWSFCTTVKLLFLLSLVWLTETALNIKKVEVYWIKIQSYFIGQLTNVHWGKWSVRQIGVYNKLRKASKQKSFPPLSCCFRLIHMQTNTAEYNLSFTQTRMHISEFSRFRLIWFR